MSKYAIVVDYFMWDEENEEEYTEKNYLYIAGKHKIYMFNNTPNIHSDELKTFTTRREAEEYIVAHNLEDGICYENVRPERI